MSKKQDMCDMKCDKCVTYEQVQNYAGLLIYKARFPLGLLFGFECLTM